MIVNLTYNKRYTFDSVISKDINRVYIFNDNLENEKVVVKFYDSERVWSRELSYLKQFRNSSFVVQLLDYFMDNVEIIDDTNIRKMYFIIVTKKYDWDMWTFLTSVSLTEANSITLTLRILDIVKFLHDNQVIHRDIKPENFVYDSTTKNWRILDFESSTTFDRKERFRELGTIDYSPPEILNNCKPSHKSDIWALGNVIYEIFVGNLPFVDDTMSNREKINNILNFKFLPETKPLKMSIREILHCMLRSAEMERPNVHEIYDRFVLLSVISRRRAYSDII